MQTIYLVNLKSQTNNGFELLDSSNFLIKSIEYNNVKNSMLNFLNIDSDCITEFNYSEADFCGSFHDGVMWKYIYFTIEAIEFK